MKSYIIAGNWKMNFKYNEGNEFISQLSTTTKALELHNTDVYIFPPSYLIGTGASTLKESQIIIGAQNCHFEQQGAFTGELSPEMIYSAGGRSVIIGHSERRHYFNETNQDCNKKIKAAVSSGLTVIYCVGETLEERESNQVSSVIESQLKEGLVNCEEYMKHIIIAYEPVWAIGTGKVASPEQAEEVHSFIRTTLKTLFTPEIASSVRLLYGGSVQPNNAQDLLSQPNINGALIGGASLKVEPFISIVNTALSCK